MAGIAAVLLAFGAFVIGVESEAPTVLPATVQALAAVAEAIEHDLRNRLRKATIDAQSPRCWLPSRPFRSPRSVARSPCRGLPWSASQPR